MTNDGIFVGDVEDRISTEGPTAAEVANADFKAMLAKADSVSALKSALEHQVAAAQELLHFFSQTESDLKQASQTFQEERATRLQKYMARRKVGSEALLHPAQRKELISLDEDANQKLLLIKDVQARRLCWLASCARQNSPVL